MTALPKLLPDVDDLRAQERWRTHVRMVQQALNTQDGQWARAQMAHQQRSQRLLDKVPRWRQRAWDHRWGRWDRARWQRHQGLPTQTQFLHDWRRTLDALPHWVEQGEAGVRHVDPSLAESCWARWCEQVVDLLDRLLEAHPQRRGNVMPFRGLRHTLVSALHPGRPPFVQALIDGTSLERTMATAPTADRLDRSDAQGYTELHHALLAMRWDVAQALIQQGANPNLPVQGALVTPVTLESPIFLAALTGQVEAVQGLLDLGMSPNGAHAPVDAPWYSPLHVAAQSGHAPVVHRLVAHGALLDRPDGQGKTAERLADAHGHHALAAWLRAQGLPAASLDAP